MKFVTKTLISLFFLTQLISFSLISASENAKKNRNTRSTNKSKRSHLSNDRRLAAKLGAATFAVSLSRKMSRKQFDFLEESRVLAISKPGQPPIRAPPKPSPQPKISDADIRGLFSLNKEFHFGYKKVSCYRIDATVDYMRYMNFDQKLGKRWWKPSNSFEGNVIISFYKQNYVQQGLQTGYTWIITYGVETKPYQRMVNGHVLNTDVPYGWGQSDNGMPGGTKGTGFTAFRQWACSFCYVPQFKKFQCWDTILKYAIMCLE
jgi:hypothetical protein